MITRSTSKSKSKPNKQSNSQERTSSRKTRSSRRVRFDREQDIVQTNNSNEIEICDKCKSCPCDWEFYCAGIDEVMKHMLTEKVQNGKVIYIDLDGKEAENSYIRRCMYTSYTYLKNGRFIVDDDKDYSVVPMCVTDEIRRMYPSNDMTYPDIKRKDLHTFK